MRENLVVGLGELMQLSFVPRDVPTALKFWTEIMGAGPFVALEHVKVEDTRYRGVPTDVDFSIYLGYWGELQIEIVEQHNDAPSIYKDWRDADMEGLHHVCILTEDMAKTRATMAAAGASVVQEMTLPGGGEVIYADTGGGPGTMVEVLKPAPGGVAAFAYIKSLAQGWDGSAPVRRLG